MPTYRYSCDCGWKVEKFYKTLPSDARQAGAVCEECGKTAPRALGDEGFYAVGGQNGGVEKAVGFASNQDANGRPQFRDENGKVREIRTSRDVDSFQRHNALGAPRMVEWRNPVTGAAEWTQQRVRMVADPVTGEVDEAKSGAIIRGPECLVPLDGGEFSPPSETVAGRPMKNGVAVKGETMYRDPVTGQPTSAWAQREGGEPDVREAGIRRPPSGKKWS